MSKNLNHNSRRSFIAKAAKSVLGASLAPALSMAANHKRNIESLSRTNDKYSVNDQIQIALIGAGGMGTADANTAVTVPGVKLIAVCDLYDGRLEDARKKWGNDVFTTRDYRQILERKDIDAVIIATP